MEKEQATATATCSSYARAEYCAATTELSSRGAVDPFRRDQGGEALAGVKHAGLHRVVGDAEDRDDLLDRLLLVVDEVDDLGVLGRQPANAATNDGAGVLPVELDFRVVGRIDDVHRHLAVKRLGRTAIAGRQRLV